MPFLKIEVNNLQAPFNDKSELELIAASMILTNIEV